MRNTNKTVITYHHLSYNYKIASITQTIHCGHFFEDCQGSNPAMHKTNRNKRFSALFQTEHCSAAEECAYKVISQILLYFLHRLRSLGWALPQCRPLCDTAPWVKRAYSTHSLFDNEVVIQRLSAHAGSHI